MKPKIVFITTLVLALFFHSCDSMPASMDQSWIVLGRADHTIRLLGVSVDRSGGWDSLEKEVAALAPLYFWQKGCEMTGADGPADYAVFISLREREFSVGWRTRRSLALEVRIWDYRGEAPAAELLQTLPLAAGRVVSIGDGSFSSSITTGKMLSRAINRALGSLPAAGRKTKNAWAFFK